MIENNDNCKLYLTESILLGETTFTQLNSQSFYSLNKAGRSILTQIANGVAVRELIEKNNIRTEADIHKLINYLNQLEKRALFLQ